MDKCCRWCHYYENRTGRCKHDDMFTVEDTPSGNDIMMMDLRDYEDGYPVEEISFKVINPEDFSCCYWE